MLKFGIHVPHINMLSILQFQLSSIRVTHIFTPESEICVFSIFSFWICKLTPFLFLLYVKEATAREGASGAKYEDLLCNCSLERISFRGVFHYFTSEVIYYILTYYLSTVNP